MNTTVVIGNLPHLADGQEQARRWIDTLGFQGMYDFLLHCPSKRKQRGCAVVNFVAPEVAQSCTRAIDGSEVGATVAACNVQGSEALLSHFGSFAEGASMTVSTGVAADLAGDPVSAASMEASAPAWVTAMPREDRDGLVRVLADSRGLYGALSEEAKVDICSKFHISPQQLNEAIRWVSAMPSRLVHAAGMGAGIGSSSAQGSSDAGGSTGDVPPLGPDTERVLSLLGHSHRHLPLPQDSRRYRKYVPRSPYVHQDKRGNPAYPLQPTPSYDDPAMFAKYDLDTLFFIFYYQQGSYQQHLAAKELKKLSWRYHTKYLTWFQRHEEPRTTASDY